MNHLSTAAARSLLFILCVLLWGCSSPNPKPATSPAPATEAEALSRTEFTDRVENYFEYEPLHAGKPSQVRIHLTDLSGGFPVEKAEVTLVVKPKGSSQVTTQTVSRIGKVTGIYVAELTVPHAGDYDIEFHIKNDKLDERLPLSDFKVQ
jgi:5-hydroxyisourate hydrolase-like protein (transthyretin family)